MCENSWGEMKPSVLNHYKYAANVKHLLLSELQMRCLVWSINNFELSCYSRQRNVRDWLDFSSPVWLVMWRPSFWQTRWIDKCSPLIGPHWLMLHSHWSDWRQLFCGITQPKLIDLKHKQHVILSVLFPRIIDVWKILLMAEALISVLGGMNYFVRLIVQQHRVIAVLRLSSHL